MIKTYYEIGMDNTEIEQFDTLEEAEKYWASHYTNLTQKELKEYQDKFLTLDKITIELDKDGYEIPDTFTDDVIKSIRD